MHFLFAKEEATRVGADQDWGLHMREHATVPWSRVTRNWRIAVVIETALEQLFVPERENDPTARFKFLKHEFTFSERLAEVVMQDMAETPEALATVDPSCGIEVLVRRNAFAADDRWARMHRWPQMVNTPRSGQTRLASLGIACTDVALRETVRTWFDDGQEFKTFDRSNRWVSRVPWMRELYLRPTWEVAAILPDAFPAPPPPLKLTTPAQDEIKRQMLANERAQAAARRETASHEANKAATAAWRAKQRAR